MILATLVVTISMTMIPVVIITIITVMTNLTLGSNTNNDTLSLFVDYVFHYYYYYYYYIIIIHYLPFLNDTIVMIHA